MRTFTMYRPLMKANQAGVASPSARQWGTLPVPGSTHVWLDYRIDGLISLVVGTWCTSNVHARSFKIMASFRTGEIGTYCDDIDLTPRKSGQHG